MKKLPFLGLAGGLTGAGLLLLHYIFRRIFYNSDKWKAQPVPIPDSPQYKRDYETIKKLIEGVKAQPFEEVTIVSYDGTPLYGRYYHIPGHDENCPVQIQFHGYHGGAVREFAGTRQCEWELGCDTLLTDMRAHGKSGGNITTFGIRERHDVAAWCRYACRRFGKDRPVLISGVSMGAASVLMASDMPDLPENVRGVIADSPYDSPKDIICKVVEDMGLPAGPVWKLIRAAARLYGHFNIEESSALLSASRTRLPILIYHGDADRLVPWQMSRRIAGAAGDARLEIFPDGAHGVSFLRDPGRYMQIMADFVQRATGFRQE